MSHSLIGSARFRLTLLTTLCAFAIACIMSATFLGAKYTTQYHLSRQAFDQELRLMSERFDRGERVSLPGQIVHGRDNRQPGFRGGPRESIAFLIRSSSGEVSQLQLPGRLSNNRIEELLSVPFFSGEELVKNLRAEGYFADLHTSSTQELIVFSRSAYDGEDLLGDLFYFLLINSLFIPPFSLGAWFLIRRILLPIDRNIAEMEAFIHDAGHELKTPLAVALGHVSLLSKTHPSDDLHQIKKSLKSSALLIDTLVDLVSISAPKSKKSTIIPLSNIVQEVVAIHDHTLSKAGIHLDYILEKEVLSPIDPEHARLLLGNIISNAVKYSPEHSTIKIRVCSRKISITDHGVGIAPEKIPYIFDRFYRGDHSLSNGHGIGLAIVKKVADLWGIRIQVMSKIHQGTTVILHFPS